MKEIPGGNSSGAFPSNWRDRKRFQVPLKLKRRIKNSHPP